MSYKEILVHVGPTPTPALSVAVELAVAHDARLIGIGVQAPLAAAYYYGIGPLPAQAFDAIERVQAEALGKAQRRFTEAMRKAGREDQAEWRLVVGEAAEILTLHGLYADLVVVDQTGPEAGPASYGIPAELALNSARPVLVVPFVGTVRQPGSHVVVAWNASREAARAVADALPLLRRARKVDVLAVSPRQIGDLPGGDIARHLAVHGVSANVVVRDGGDLDPGSELLNYLADSGADLLVMGCYGHARVSEMVFGGVTQTLLRHMTVPVLLSH